MKSAIEASWRAATSMWYIELELKLISEVKGIEERRIYKGIEEGRHLKPGLEYIKSWNDWMKLVSCS